MRHIIVMFFDFKSAELANQNAGNPKDKGNDLGLANIQVPSLI